MECLIKTNQGEDGLLSIFVSLAISGTFFFASRFPFSVTVLLVYREDFPILTRNHRRP